MANNQHRRRMGSAQPAAALATRFSALGSALMPALLAALLAGCGGGGGDTDRVADSASVRSDNLPQELGAPTLSGDTALDGYNWINYRRALLGLSVLSRNAKIDTAAQGHADYLRLNNTVSHDQTPGAAGFTGVTLPDRLGKAGYALTGSHAIGEVISATSKSSGFYHAEELITAIYHRFVMFEPIFKEVGTGATSTAGGYTYFTADLTAINGYGLGLGAGKMINYPANNQTNVPTTFLSDTESPDPVPNQNEVGYPISVHADAGRNDGGVAVRSFTVTPRGGSAMTTLLLSRATDSRTSESAAAIIPLTPLRRGTVYDVRFDGTVGGVPTTRAWSFTTDSRP
jgi:uncharacterized protein YkwD